MIERVSSPGLSFMGLTLVRPGWFTASLAVITALGVATVLVKAGQPADWIPGARAWLGVVVGTGVLVHRSGAPLRGPTAFRALVLTGVLALPWGWLLALNLNL